MVNNLIRYNKQKEIWHRIIIIVIIVVIILETLIITHLLIPNNLIKITHLEHPYKIKMKLNNN